MNKSETLKPPENFDFPFTPYQIQDEFMRKLYETIETKGLGIFESPTGTGKSLSIICGAIKWLKDHNVRERDILNGEVVDLESRKEELDKDNDWFSAQSKGIEITRRLSELKLKQSNINEYDDKMKELSRENKKRNHRRFKNSNKEIISETEPKDDLEIDDDDLLIEETSSIKDNDLSDEEDNNYKFNPTKIFICSRTHSQLSQFVGEIKKSPFGQNIRVTSLGSRQNYCINPNVNKLKNISLINERCLDMQKNERKSCRRDEDGKVTKRMKRTSGGKCEFFKQSNIEDLRDLSLMEIMDIEDLVINGKELRGCPYYSSRKAAEDAEIVLVPYNTILHKATREANGIKLKDNVIIIDEAHNLLEAMAQMYSTELSYYQLFYCERQLKGYKDKYNSRFSSINLLRINQMLFILKNLKKLLEKHETNENNSEIFTVSNFVFKAEIDNFNMFQLVQFCKESRLAQKLHGFAMKHPQTDAIEEQEPKRGVKQFLASIENKKQPPKEETIEEQEKPHPTPSNPLLAVISFLEVLTYSYDDGRIIIHISQDKDKKKFQFMVLNPAEHFKEVIKEARSVIVAGGTMKPIEEFRDRLFKNSGADPSRISEFSCDHIVAPENILPVILTKGPNDENLRFNFENRFSMGAHLKEILIRACKTIPGGIVVFFPSYKYESWVWQQLKTISFGRAIFREPQQSSGVDTILENYAKTIQKTKQALLFSVVGGKLSEGLNFSDDLGRCVIVVGMPYANIHAVDLKEKMAYLDKLEGSGASQRFYEGMCMKAVNQCIGRAVRHKNDFATVILVDERYSRSATKNALPGWIKRSLVTCDFKECFQKIDKFFQEKRSL